MAQVIFFLHGAGKHEEGWHKDALESFIETRLLLGRDDDFNARYIPIALSYGDIFEEYWGEHNSRAKALANLPIPGNANSFIRKIIDFAKSNPSDDHPWIATQGDVVLYLITSLGPAVRNRVWDDIIKVLEEHNTPMFSIIAHSLGTRVIHDVLQRSFTGDVGSNYELFGKPKVLAQIANITRLTSFNEGHLGPGMVVHPSYDPDTGACWRYINAWHPLDPSAVIRRFNPLRYPAFQGVQGLFDISAKPGDVINIKEIHSLTNYLKIPEITAAIVNGLENYTTLHPGPIDEAAIEQAREKYEQKTIAGSWTERLEQIEQFDLNSIDSWLDIIGVIDKW